MSDDKPFLWRKLYDGDTVLGLLGVYHSDGGKLGVEGHVVTERYKGEVVDTAEVFTASIERHVGGCLDLELRGSVHLCGREQAEVIGKLIDKLFDLAEED